MARSYDIAILSQKVEQIEGSIKANDVIANPAGETTADLSAIGIDGSNYNIPKIYDLVKTKSVSHTATVAAGGTVNWNPMTDDIGMTGYTPIGVIGFKFNNVSLIWVNHNIEDSDYGMLITNISNASVTQTFTYNVLYIKATPVTTQATTSTRSKKKKEE